MNSGHSSGQSEWHHQHTQVVRLYEHILEKISQKVNDGSSPLSPLLPTHPIT